MTFFTSINNNYLAKARVLAKSVKKHIPGSHFVLVLSDALPEKFNIKDDPFDEVITIDKLGIPVENLNLWIFMHTVVELCTAVKGQALYYLLEKYDKVVYIDPDIVVYDNLDVLDKLLNTYDIIFTPHQTVPEKYDTDVISNELCSLQHGTYNFGFFAVRNNDNGKAYAKWYRDRLVKYCYDDKMRGLFTDQRWGDIAPALFDNLLIWKDPGANVSTWNLSNRVVTKQKDRYYVNEKPMLFYHFSGIDSGAQLMMLNKYSKGNPLLYELRNWYIKEIKKNGQLESEKFKGYYDLYSDGTQIQYEERKVLRDREDVQEYFKDVNPYIKVENPDSVNYYAWFIHEKNTNKRNYQSKEEILDELEHLKKRYDYLFEERKELIRESDSFFNSKSWKITRPLRKISSFMRKTKKAIVKTENNE